MKKEKSFVIKGLCFVFGGIKKVMRSFMINFFAGDIVYGME